ncbi:leucine-rich repeat-containing G-protein coupled receptor 4-like [Drosophila eugracilis]|uniref:leucine-rich repeat-containing G-protein coupled receptor 4-like n=1 Tax=Drosophila eugracilis TaxID=29029 RepID=UPI001BD94779|nr:leucine-rich repeat-containing G-protein coupled receptor 4-like [Drosophila eugracilis]
MKLITKKILNLESMMFFVYLVFLSSVSGSMFPPLENTCSGSYCHIMYRNYGFSEKKAPKLLEFHFTSCDDLKVLQLMPNLRTLELEFCTNEHINKINPRSIPNLSTLQLRRGNLSGLNDEHFAKWPDIKVLDLGGNSIATVTNETFYGVPHLSLLALPGNDIQILPQGIFETLPELLHLDLSGNRISNLEGSIFSGNPKLEMLLLNRNPLTSISPSALISLANLRLLDLSNCGPLSALTLPGAHSIILDNSGLKSLEIEGSVFKLSAKKNQITNIRLHYKSSLTELDLQNNSLSTYDIPRLLMGMWRLQHLDLSNNLIHDFPAAGSDNTSELFLLPNLKFLNLSGNFLKRLHYDSPIPWARLTHLDLSFSGLFFLQSSTIESAFNLEALYIQGNRLRYVPPTTFQQSHPGFKEVALYDNIYTPEAYKKATMFFRDIKVNVIEKSQCEAQSNDSLKDVCANFINKAQVGPTNRNSLKEKSDDFNEEHQNDSPSNNSDNETSLHFINKSPKDPSNKTSLNEKVDNSKEKPLNDPRSNENSTEALPDFANKSQIFNKQVAFRNDMTRLAWPEVNGEPISVWTLVLIVALSLSLGINVILIKILCRYSGRHIVPQATPQSSLETIFIHNLIPAEDIRD